MKKLMRFFKDEDGATMVEYGLMLALIAVVCIGTVTLLGGQADTTFSSVEQSLATANGGGS